MTYRHIPLRRILPLLAVACLAMPLPSANAAISGRESALTSIGGVADYKDTTAFTSADLALLKERRKDVATKMTQLKKDIATQEKALKDGDATATDKLAKLKTDLKEMVEIDKALATLITEGIPETPTDTGNSGEDGSGGGGGGGIGDTIKQALMSAITQQLMGGGGLGNLTQGFQSLAGNLPGGIGNLLGGTTGGTTDATDMGTTGAVKPASEKEREEKAAKEDSMAECSPESVTSRAGKDADDKVTTPKTTEQFPGKAKDDYVGPAESKSTTEANPGKAADDVVKPKTPTPCRVVEYNKKDPTSMGDMKGGAGTDKITSEADADKYLGKYLCDPSNSNCKTNGQQCASLTKYFCGVGSASSWQKGVQVKGNNIPVGTCIATANYNGKYGPSNAPGGVSGGSHTGVYLGQNEKGVIILHQWNGSGGAQKTIIPWSAWGSNSKEGGNKYYTIANQQSFYGIPSFLPTLAASLNLLPVGEGLAFTGKVTYNEL